MYGNISNSYIIVLICLCTWWSSCIVKSLGAGEQCIEGVYHKSRPTPETAEYEFCKPWKNLTCCTTQLDNEVAKDDAPLKYNDTWHLCGNLSANCLQFWKQQECFYQCSPYVYRWKNPLYKGAIKDVPICAEDCDAWYNACKDDLICVENVLEDYNKTVNYRKVCPNTPGCIKYSEMYGSGKNLCTKMWGDSYKYVQKNGDNCMKFWFDRNSPNPNAKVDSSSMKSAPENFLMLIVISIIYNVVKF